jgi:hypothetical protein
LAASTLLASAILAWASAAGFLLCARLALRGTNESGGARLSLAVFWMGAAGVAAIQGARSFSASFGYDSFILIRALDQAATPAYCLSAAGLLYYVLYLLTGRARLAIPVFAYYMVMMPVLRVPVEMARPVGYDVGEWNVNLVYEGSLAGPAYTTALALTALPLLAAMLAYFALIWQVNEPAVRYRVVCTAIGFVLWIGVEVVVWAAGLASTGPGEIARRVVGLAVALVVGIGYFPPMALRRRWAAHDVVPRRG